MIGSGVQLVRSTQTSHLRHIIVDVGWFAFVGLVAVFFFRSHRYAPRLYMALLGTNLALVVFDVGARYLSDVGQPLDLRWLARGVVPAAIWIPYFLLSERVRATFVK